MLGICVDSNSQLPTSLARRFGIEVVPLIVTVDGVEHREGVDLDSDRFYGFWDNGHSPEITTSQPSPADFAATYQKMVDGGASGILSVHIGGELSGTLNAARLGAEEIGVPVRHVDTGTASFGIACCAWAAAEAIAKGATLEDAARVAQDRAAGLGTAFIVGVPQLAELSGRVPNAGIADAAEEGIPVIAMSDGDVEIIANVTTTHAAVVAMTDYALGWTPSLAGGLRAAIGTSDESSFAIGRALTELLQKNDHVADVVQYRVGPSVGAHMGPGTAGLFVF